MDLRTRAKPNTPEKFLWARPESRHLWFRMAVPTRYREVEPRSIIQQSLRTSDQRHASILAGRKRAELEEEWEAAVAKTIPDESLPSATVPTIIELQIAAADVGYSGLRGKLDSLYQSRRITNEDQYASYIEAIRKQLLRFIRTRDGEARQHWEKLADRCVATRNWLLPKSSDSYNSLLQFIADASIEALRVEVEKRAGGPNQGPANPTVVTGLEAAKSRAPKGEAILDLFDRYAAQRLAEGRKRQDTINQDRKVVESFAAFVGADRSLRFITAADVRDWRDAVASLPPAYRKRKANSGLTMREAAARARGEGQKGVSLNTVNKYISTVSPLFDWARPNGYADINPCDGMFYTFSKGKNPRPPFEAGELNKLLLSPLFTGFLADGKEHLPGDVQVRDWRFWIPLICMFTGARIGEIAQLRVGDIAQEHGVWFIHIRHDKNSGQTTKSGHSRPAPVHSKLAALGFLKFVEQQCARAERDRNQRLFAELMPNERGHIGALPSRFFREYLTKIGIKNGADGRGAHSFRHSMADQLRMADLLDNQVAIALGHNQKTVTSGYGRLKQGTVTMMSAMLEAAKFDGVKFDHLTADRGVKRQVTN